MLHSYSLGRRSPKGVCFFDPQTVIAEIDYHHPLYSFASMATQAELPQLNGQQNTYYCGSYFGYGFHEDAVKAGVAVANAFGVEL